MSAMPDIQRNTATRKEAIAHSLILFPGDQAGMPLAFQRLSNSLQQGFNAGDFCIHGGQGGGQRVQPAELVSDICESLGVVTEQALRFRAPTSIDIHFAPVDALGIWLPLQLINRRVQDIQRHGMHIVRKCTGQAGVAESIDQPWNATGIFVNNGNRVSSEHARGIRQAGHPEPVKDVITGIFFREGLKVVAQPYTLLQLLHFRGIQQVIERGLPNQDDVQYLLFSGFQPGEHADFLKHLHAEIMRIVNHQQQLLELQKILDKKSVEHVEQFNLLGVKRIQAKLDQNRLEKLHLIQLRLKYFRYQYILIE